MGKGEERQKRLSGSDFGDDLSCSYCFPYERSLFLSWSSDLGPIKRGHAKFFSIYFIYLHFTYLSNTVHQGIALGVVDLYRCIYSKSQK